MDRCWRLQFLPKQRSCFIQLKYTNSCLLNIKANSQLYAWIDNFIKCELLASIQLRIISYRYSYILWCYFTITAANSQSDFPISNDQLQLQVNMQASSSLLALQLLLYIAIRHSQLQGIYVIMQLQLAINMIIDFISQMHMHIVTQLLCYNKHNPCMAITAVSLQPIRGLLPTASQPTTLHMIPQIPHTASQLQQRAAGRVCSS